MFIMIMPDIPYMPEGCQIIRPARSSDDHEASRGTERNREVLQKSLVELQEVDATADCCSKGSRLVLYAAENWGLQPLSY
jgi:hypothetical protein